MKFWSPETSIREPDVDYLRFALSWLLSGLPLRGKRLHFSKPLGVAKGADGARQTREEARSSCVRFSPTGREWAACTTDGLVLYSLDEAAIFDPSDLDESVTPEATEVRSFVSSNL